MTIAAEVMQKLQALPEEQQVKVLEFITQLPCAPAQPRRPLFGLFKGFDTTEEEIAEARREMWGNFPRENI